MGIKIKYDGKYPNLCSGHLVVTVDNVRCDFGNYALHSTGGIKANYSGTRKGPWEVDYPKDFPKHLKTPVLEAINSNIEHGCCGGCI